MKRIALNKSSLNHENAKLKSYQQFLPALDLKRKQIIAELNSSRRQLEEFESATDLVRRQVEQQLAMLADKHMTITDLVVVKNIVFHNENLVGIRLPHLDEIELDIRPYSLMFRPHWFDRLSELLQRQVRLKVQLRFELRRRKLLDQALRKTTQRLNLFDKVLIPQARDNIKKISIYLSDAECAAVVRAKITKQKQQRRMAR